MTPKSWGEAEQGEDESSLADDQTNSDDEELGDPEKNNVRHTLPSSKGVRAAVNVSITIDSSMDVDKLQKQLELLKRFGAI